MAINSRVLVPGAPRLPFPLGLFSVVDFRHGTIGGADRFMNGVVFREDYCEGINGYAYDCATVPTKLSTPANGQVDADPFVVYALTECFPGGYTEEERREDAMQRFLLREQTAVEKQLWSGVFGAHPYIADSSANPAVTTVTVTDARQALAQAEDFISSTYGSLGIIHMSRGTEALMPNDFYCEGDRIYSKTGTPVVLGSGYPAGQVAATPNIFGYRSDTFSTTFQHGTGMDFQNNKLYSLVERDYLLGYDDCGTFIATIVATASSTTTT